jgi:alanine racemase
MPVAVTAKVVKIRARTRRTVTGVVNADAHGHGAVTVARAAGAAWLGTTGVREASAQRATGAVTRALDATSR